jgi:hypothetical protein
LAEGFRLQQAIARGSRHWRFKQVIGDGLRLQTDTRQNTEVAVAIHVLNRMLAFGRPNSVRVM